MSVLRPKADVRQRESHVRYVPLTDIAFTLLRNGPSAISRQLFGGNNNSDLGATLTPPLNVNETSIGEGFERPALGEAIHAPTVQVKVGNQEGGRLLDAR